ncbi:MAG: hypothetical protein JWO91_360 [Acidobacteriaceae bacterium]|nr:hypothetical protein [Acidobacteriaceae bacterium]
MRIRRPRLLTFYPHKNIVSYSQQLAKLVNRVIRVFRSFGLVTSLAEMHSTELGDVDRLLLSWQVEHDVAETGGWRAIVKSDAQTESSATKGADVSLPSNFLESGRWPEIEEALQGNREPPPEREFGANCIQHLSAYNYRAAELESIIGLEIVLADYLREVLPSKGLTKEEVESALGTAITLNFRLSVLLRLVFFDSDLKNANLQEVLKVVNWVIT